MQSSVSAFSSCPLALITYTLRPSLRHEENAMRWPLGENAAL